MNNEPVAWMQTWQNQDGELKRTVNIEQIGKQDIPLYTHPVKELPTKENEYWLMVEMLRAKVKEQQAEIEALKVKAHEWYLIAMGKAQEK